MKEYGEILDEGKTDVENTTIFRLDPSLKPGLKDKNKKKKDDDPMWSSESSTPMDWICGDE